MDLTDLQIASLSLNEALGKCHFSPKGDLIAATAMDKYVYIVNTTEMKVIHKIDGESKTVTCKAVKFSPNGEYLAVGGLKNELTIDLYSTKDWKFIASCKVWNILSITV